jgi:hypothetical protein
LYEHDERPEEAAPADNQMPEPPPFPTVTPEQWRFMTTRERKEYIKQQHAYNKTYRNPAPSKFKLFMLAVWPLLAYIGAQLAVGFIISFIAVFSIMVSSGVTAAEPDMSSIIEIIFYSNVAVQAIFIPIFLWVFIRCRRNSAEVSVLLSPKPSFVTPTVLGMVAAAGFFLNIYGLFALITSVLPTSITEQYSDLMEVIMHGPQWLTVVSLVILAPVVEELIIRGLCQRRLEAIMSPNKAIVLSALLFGIMHMNLIQGVYAFILGLFLGWIYKRGRNIMIPIMAHVTFNGMNYVVVFVMALLVETGLLSESAIHHLTEDTHEFAGACAVLGLILAAIMVVLYERSIRKRTVAEPLEQNAA